MRFYTVALLAGATAAAAGNTATLLLPGFKGQDLEASIIESNGDATTYKITCPKTVAACGIAGEGMTAIAAPTSMQLQNIDLQGTLGTVSCNIAGTTYASCQASAGTVTPSGTLAQEDLNWMPVTISATPTPTSTSTPTHTPTSTSTSTSTPTPTSTSSEISTSTTEVSSTFTPTITSSPTLVISTTKKPSSALISSAPVASSTPLVVASTSAAASGSAPAASATAYNAAGQLVGSIWTVGGAFLALACAFA
ncbi:hypothetical protein DTO013E5_10090 [Penicillium roqueforti]|uniref:Genomic scaffold, ProqFM164S02 n=1 Tax=Penicillium roqueforti (strain FM164) TaxID=1365484 RepID=W6Q727_PENRF|nr:uncharacterized protein LCP9604111_9451 [Penicillium roqueforti]CDM32528.1 unnamed protein product [Penicillium roqueforti FM164]KAF9238425.1 hypothetical protein LCP9604111_9451 [Penicillium roqueforti]KAI1828983.1 hypothetical protein CBS147337_10211 [Penicillium roqueforti]KAI2672420.1 hypothetical protein CBS147355_8140 [Penicillium roqueforti]KAI2675643.1 hypothetical protein LCP963914a_8480 [Penicillium roqueforti]